MGGDLLGTLLALASALCYGVADFTGGLLSRRVHFAAVALIGQLGGLVLTLLVAPFWPATSVTAADLGWGALSGVGTGLAMLSLFRGLSRGAMSVVVPVSAVGGVALPVLAGVAFLGDRPSLSAWVGIVVSVPALWLVSRTGDGERATAAASLDGLLAGVGIAVQYVALAQAAAPAGGWPVVAGRTAATVALLPLVRTIPGRPGIRQASGAAGTGALAATALICYLVATRQQLLVVAVVLSSFYPAVPVLLGITALRERLSRYQTTGLVGAALAIGLLTFG
jgi:drug/metabolite transporter (DMT)-like permease